MERGDGKGERKEMRGERQRDGEEGERGEWKRVVRSGAEERRKHVRGKIERVSERWGEREGWCANGRERVGGAEELRESGRERGRWVAEGERD